MSPKTILRLARMYRPAIGKQAEMYGPDFKHEDWEAARFASDEAVRQCKYLIEHLDNRHDAVLFSRAVGMPGYINFR